MSVAALDDLPLADRPVTARIAADRLRMSVRTVQKWVTKGYLQPAACIVANRQPVYWELDVMLAEATARTRDSRNQRRVA